jgi:hypothetical protein
MLGQAEIDTFWTDVEGALKSRRRAYDSERTLRAIMRYRNALAGAGVTNMVYHREPAEVAADILRGGYDEDVESN